MGCSSSQLASPEHPLPAATTTDPAPVTTDAIASEPACEVPEPQEQGAPHVGSGISAGVAVARVSLASGSGSGSGSGSEPAQAKPKKQRVKPPKLAPAISRRSSRKRMQSGSRTSRRQQRKLTEGTSYGSGALRFRLGECIGRGAAGTVYLALQEADGSLVAAKAVTAVSDDAIEGLRREIELLRSFAHPNIVRWLGVVVDKDVAFLLTEWVSGGSLSKVLRKFQRMGEPLVRRYARQMLDGLRYLHSNKVAHRDIKPGNVLVTNVGTLKLADFGTSQRTDNLMSPGPGSQPGLVVGTPYYLAPEAITTSGSRPDKHDIWSFGCTLLELYSGQPPWKREGFKTAQQVMFHIASTDRTPHIPSAASDSFRNFLQACFARDPARRPSASELQKHPWLTEDGDSAARSRSSRPTARPVLRHGHTTIGVASAPDSKGAEDDEDALWGDFDEDFDEEMDGAASADGIDIEFGSASEYDSDDSDELVYGLESVPDEDTTLADATPANTTLASDRSETLPTAHVFSETQVNKFVERRQRKIMRATTLPI